MALTKIPSPRSGGRALAWARDKSNATRQRDVSPALSSTSTCTLGDEEEQQDIFFHALATLDISARPTRDEQLATHVGTETEVPRENRTEVNTETQPKSQKDQPSIWSEISHKSQPGSVPNERPRTPRSGEKRSRAISIISSDYSPVSYHNPRTSSSNHTKRRKNSPESPFRAKPQEVIELDFEEEDEVPTPFQLPTGAEVFDLEAMEEQLEAEVFQEIIPERRSTQEPLVQNAPEMEPPWAEIETLRCNSGSIREKKTLELDDGTFLFVKAVWQNMQTDEVVIHGLRLKRCSKLHGLVMKKINELCFIHDTDLDDPRSMMLQSTVQVSPARVLKIRQMIRTNKPWPQNKSNTSSVPVEHCGSKQAMAEYVRDQGRLVVRMRFITTFKTSKDRMENDRFPNNFVSRKIVVLEEAESTPNMGISPQELRQQWRGKTIPGGASIENFYTAQPRAYRRAEGSGEFQCPICQMRFHDPELLVSHHTTVHEASQKEHHKYSYGDTFCGAGGTTRGALMAGLNILWGIDCSPEAGVTWRRNFPSAKHYEMDAQSFVGLEGNRNLFIVDILHLSPPCQVFSPAHTNAGKDDEMNFAALLAVEELIKKSRPRVITLEQTYGIFHRKFKDAFNTLINMFTSLSFSISWQVVKLQRYGLPQKRRRLIIIASCPGEDLPSCPPPTHAEHRGHGLKAFETPAHCLARVPRRAQNHDIQAARQTRARLYAWDASKLANCITTNGGTNGCHPSGTRGLTAREFASLQGFPHNHVFCGTATNIKKQIGNAVPPLVAKALLSSVRKHLETVDGVVVQNGELID